MGIVDGFGKSLVFGQFMILLIWKCCLKRSFGSEFGSNVGDGLGFITGNRFFLVGGKLPVKGIDKTPIFKKFLFSDFSYIKGNYDFMQSECVLEEFKIQAVVVLSFWL